MPKLITARCQSCGNESEVEWTRGKKCPRCGSEKFYPVVFVGKAQARGTQKARGTASQKPIGAILAVLLLAAGVVALVVSVRSTSKNKEYYRTVTMICTNPDCGKMFQMKVATKDPFPEVTCPYCKQKTAYRAVQCRNCGEIFPLKRDGKENPTIDLVCPYCGSSDINLDSGSIPVKEEAE